MENRMQGIQSTGRYRTASCPECGKAFRWSAGLTVKASYPEKKQSEIEEEHRKFLDFTEDPDNKALLEQMNEKGALENFMRTATRFWNLCRTVALRNPTKEIKPGDEYVLTQIPPDTMDSVTLSQIFTCPRCQAPLHIIGDFLPVGIVKALKAEPRVPEEVLRRRSFVEECRYAGMLGSFEQAVTNQRVGNLGKAFNVGGFWLQFILNATNTTVPRIVYEEYARRLGGPVEFWGTKDVIMVLREGMVRAFIPVRLMGRIRDGLEQVQGVRISGEVLDFGGWIRTKNGFVPADCKMLLSDMRSKTSFGDFAKKDTRR